MKQISVKKMLPYIILAVLLCLTAGIRHYWSSHQNEMDQARFAEYADSIENQIRNRLHNYMMILDGTAGLFAVSREVTWQEWRTYFAFRDITRNFPGIQAVAYAEYVTAAEVTSHTQRIRQQGFPHYSIWPTNGRTIYVPVVMVTPFDARNKAAMGYDGFSNPVRRAAMEWARDNGTVAMSGQVTLAVRETTVQPGFLMYAPVYTRFPPSASMADRQAAIKGFVAGAFRMHDLIRGIFPELTSKITFKIHDGPRVSPESLMYTCKTERNAPDQDHTPMFSSRKILDLYGHQWTVEFCSTPVFESGVDRWTPHGILLAGFAISLFVFLWMTSEAKTIDRAQALADKLSASLRDKEAKLRRITDSVSDVIWTVDLNLNTTYVSKSIEKLVGEPRDVYMKKPVEEKYAPETLAYVQSIIKQELAKEKDPETDKDRTRLIELKEYRKDGSTVDIAMHVSFVRNEKGTITGFQGVTRDITAQKNAEQQEMARRIAEQANQAKSMFVANMSHEIRTPLNAIIGFARILEKDPSLTAVQTEQVQTISRSGRHLLHLINDILDISKIEAGRLTLDSSDFNLHDLVEDISMMFRSRAEAKDLQVVVETHKTVPRYVTADEGKLRQILVNLTGNAVKFTRTGTVTLRVRAETAPEKQKKKPQLFLRVAVADTGPGIPEPDLERIFDPFDQSVQGKQTGGTGLGLAISRRLVEMMGGELTVESTLGKGSVFRFSVPVAPAEGARETPAQETRQITGLAPGTEPVKILVVDDQKDNRDLLRTLLTGAGFEVREAENGREAVDLFTRWSPHAVLMDLRLPVMDGYEAARQIKSTKTGRHIPVIAVTASAFKDSEEQVFADGMDGFISKPFEPEELFDVLKQALKIEYAYADTPDQAKDRTSAWSLTSGDLDSLPEDLVQAMLQAVEQGDMARLRGLITRVEKTDARVAHGLNILAGQYAYDKLMKLLKGEKTP
jgi:PAS domain S-box-containing protein